MSWFHRFAGKPEVASLFGTTDSCLFTRRLSRPERSQPSITLLKHDPHLLVNLSSLLGQRLHHCANQIPESKGLAKISRLILARRKRLATDLERGLLVCEERGRGGREFTEACGSRGWVEDDCLSNDHVNVDLEEDTHTYWTSMVSLD